jgi:uncharacterized membrane protein YhaH (DUF805 family)
MKNFLLNYPPLDPFRRPFHIRTPMPRLDYWLFYIGYVFALSFTLGGVEFFSKLIDPSHRLDMILGLAFMLSVAVWLIYLAASLLSATARRMKDSGYRRSGLALSVLLGSVSMASLSRDIYAAYEARLEISPIDPVFAFSEFSIWSTIVLVLTLVYVFLGTIRPSKRAAKKP